MRGYMASSISVAACAALVLPLSLPTGATAATPHRVLAPDVPGSTQSLPLPPAPTARSHNRSADRWLSTSDVGAFSMVGVVWSDPDAELRGSVEVRTRPVGSGTWSAWQDVETHNHEHGADPDTRERATGMVRGATAPLWVGASDAVEVRVRADSGDPARLPKGLRLELVDPGEAAETAPPRTASVLPAAGPRARRAGAPFIGPRPRIITRKGWGARESLRERGLVYTKTVKAAFVHHSATGNGYSCKQAPSVLRSIYRYHVVSSGWRDFGYNFAVDKCGNIYEGRAGGVTKPVLGAHTLGFNRNSMGIAVLGTYSRSNPPASAVTAVARLTAWKIGLFKGNPKGKVTLTSGGSGKHYRGKKVRFNVIAGHRDGFTTDCPGSRLYKKLGTARTVSAKYQGRR
ncbi:peptidoglycan recognition protein [Streptomyces sp. NPDC020965]|uniref:peptidoglycan recognition protein n=1 Tax=Streptomyces sp. NPDC020965 TaxID=3365105 RepID=UPI0037B1E157